MYLVTIKIFDIIKALDLIRGLLIFMKYYTSFLSNSQLYEQFWHTHFLRQKVFSFFFLTSIQISHNPPVIKVINVFHKQLRLFDSVYIFSVILTLLLPHFGQIINLHLLKSYLSIPQHFLYFLPLPHGHGSFLPIFLSFLIVVP